jgi:peptide/nickel transport system permease protein
MSNGVIGRFLRRNRITGIYLFAFIVLAVVLLMSVVPRLFTRYDPYELMADDLLPPGKGHILGTDEVGRDLFARMVYGTRNTMYVGLGSSLLAVLVGIPIGLLAGYASGVTDLILMRILDSFMSFPAILLSVLIISVTGANPNALIVTIAVVNFPRFARIVRGNALFIKKMDYVEATRTFGAKPGYIMFVTILGNCLSPIVVQFTLLVAVAILIEASMSFLGLGIQPPAPAWGSMLHTAQLYLRQAWWYALVPGFMIFLVVYSMNIFGDWLRDFTDPKKRTR